MGIKFAAALAMAGTVVPLMAGSESLPDALVAAYHNSALLESSRALLRAQDEAVALAVAGTRPSINARAGVDGTIRRAPTMQSAGRMTTDSLDGTLQLSGELLLYDGGDSKLVISAEEEGIKALRQSLIETEQNVLLNAAQAFHNVLRQDELLVLEENGRRLIETELEAARHRFELGEITRTDVSLVEASLAASKSRVFLRQGELEISRQQYQLATGAMPGALEPTPPLPELPTTLQAALNIAAQNHPSILRAQHTVAAARLNLKRAETLDSPRVYLEGSIRTNRNLSDFNNATDSATVSLTTTVPLSTGGRLSALFRQAVAQAEKASLDLQHQARVVSQRVSIAWARLEIAQSSITARQQQVVSAELAHQGMKQEAALGARTTLDRLDTEQKLLEAQTNLVTGINDRDMAVYSLLETMGLMTVKHLGLGIPVYNPEENFNKVKDAPITRERKKLLDAILSRS